MSNFIFQWVEYPEQEEEKKKDLMSQSLISFHGVFRGRRRHPELFPAMPRDRLFATSTDRINKEMLNRGQSGDSVKFQAKRAVSMTRLDQLAQPRRRYLEETIKSKISPNSGNNTNSNPTDCLSIESMSYMNPSNNYNKHSNSKPSPSRGEWTNLRTGRYKSMTQLSIKTSPNNIDNKSYNSDKAHNYSNFCNQNKEKSKSMIHLSAKPPPPPPRQTRASKLRTQTMTIRNSRSSMSLNTDSLSPTRPISSMSSSTDGSVMEVKRRVKPAVPRKPRPLSIGSPYAIKQKVEDKDVTPRESRAQDKPYPTPPLRQNRARSAGGTPRPLSLASPDSEPNTISPKPAPPRKPAHVKAAAMARKAIKQSTSDVNLSEKTVPSKKTNKSNSEEEMVPKKLIEEIVVPLVEPKNTEISAESPNVDICDNDMPSNVSNNSFKKELSAEDYKKMMAEKRRLAREQAEREAEIERQRIEKEKLEEEERIRHEEEEQRKLEEEQLRLIELQREAEEERLQKAMEENRFREEEENKRKAEEQRLRLEREEKEKKAKEEAEKQRLELEERLRRDEEERLQRKKKLEAIMSRTRKTPTVRGSSPTTSPDETPEPQLTDHSNSSTPEKAREVAKNHQNMLKNEQKEDNLVIIKTNVSDINDINNSVANNHTKPDLVEDVNRAVLQNRNNGVSALNGSHLNSSNNNNIHIQDFKTDERFDDNLFETNSMSSVSDREVNQSLDQLINLNYSTTTNMEDVFNSNHVTSNAFISTNGSNIKSQEQTITDLLS